MATDGPQSQVILVVGGGIAGVTAALEAAEAGCDVVLLEQGPTLGGRVSRFNRYFPKLCHPTCGLEINYQRIKKNPRIKLLTMTTVEAVEGGPGAFKVSAKTAPRYVTSDCTACGDCAKASTSEVENGYNYGLDKVKVAYLPHEHAFPMRYVIAPDVIGTPEADAIKAACKYGAVDLADSEKTFELTVGAIVWATGWTPYDAGKITPYAYDQCPDIVTNVEMERLASHNGPTGGKIVRPSNGEPAKKVALIQCAGSRDHNHLSYCSGICCLGSMKHAAYVREQYDDADVDIYYIDIRAHDKLEAFYNRVRADEHVHFIKSKPATIVVGDDGRPAVCGEDTVTREVYARPYDLVVLATGMEPSVVGGFKPTLHLDVDDYGFLVPKLEGGGGMFPAGVAGGPKDVSSSVQSATAAALRAVQTVSG